MRIVRLVLLCLMLLPTAALASPCCEEPAAEACCPLDGDCTAPEEECASASPVVMLAAAALAHEGPVVAASTAIHGEFGDYALSARVPPAPPRTSLSARSIPLRN